METDPCAVKISSHDTTFDLGFKPQLKRHKSDASSAACEGNRENLWCTLKKVPYLYITLPTPHYICQSQSPVCPPPVSEQTSVREKIEPVCVDKDSPNAVTVAVILLDPELNPLVNLEEGMFMVRRGLFPCLISLKHPVAIMLGSGSQFSLVGLSPSKGEILLFVSFLSLFSISNMKIGYVSLC